MKWKNPHRVAVAITVGVFLLTVPVASGKLVTPIVPLRDELFVPVAVSSVDPVRDTRELAPIVDRLDPTAPPTRPTIALPDPVPRVTRPPVLVQSPSTQSRSVSGKASYYCTRAHPICHYKYPVGSMVAAACGDLRRAIGSDWRGRLVTVKTADAKVVVKLVDYCASEDKLIDLYEAPFMKIGPTWRGWLKVRVYW